MSELDDIKARAEERRKIQNPHPELVLPKLKEEAEADLDRAIAIAEEVLVDRARLEKERAWEISQRNQARADVVKLRDAGKAFDADPHDILGTCIPGRKGWRPCGTCDGMRKLLTDTEHYEQYRP